MPRHRLLVAESARIKLNGVKAPGGQRLGSLKFYRRESAKYKENHHNHQLRYQEWRLGLRGRQGLERRDFQKELRDQNEDIEIEGSHRGDDVSLSPSAGEVHTGMRAN